jgi:AraC-like DNA-binding protein
MDYKRFVLSYYKNAVQGIHVQRIACTEEARKPHNHSYYQLYYVLQGSLLHSTAHGEAALSAGDLFLIPPGEVHSIRASEEAEVYTVSFMPDIFGEVSDQNRFAASFLKALPSVHALFSKAEISEESSMLIRDLLDKIYLEFSEERLGFGEVIRAYVLALVTVLARSYADRMPRETGEDETAARIAHCAAYIEENFSGQITVSEMAKACAMSQSFFCKAFLAHTGQMFHKYLHGCRIRAAIRYMEKGYKITGIYGLVGYNDFSTFYRNFKKITGCAPKQYVSSGARARKLS